MTDHDPEDPNKRPQRKPSALDQLAKLREGLRDGQRGRRMAPSEASRRAREAFGEDDEGRVAPPNFGDRDGAAGRDSEVDRAGRRSAARLGDAEEADDASLVRSMLRDIRPSRSGDAPTDRHGRDEDRYEPQDEDKYGAPSYDAQAYDDAEYETHPDDDPDYDDPVYDDRGYDGDRDREDDRFDAPVYSASGEEAPMRRATRGGPMDTVRNDARDAEERRDLGRYSAERLRDRDEPRERSEETTRRAPGRAIVAASPATSTVALGQADPPPGTPPAPFGALERMIAGRYLRSRRKEGFISVIASLSLLGVTLGVAVLIVVMSVMNGFRADLVSKIVGLDGHMTITEPDGSGIPRRVRLIADYDAVAKELDSKAGVILAAPLVESPAFVTGNTSEGVGALVRGMRRDDLVKIDPVWRNPEASLGSLDEFGEKRGVAIGWELARALDVGPGDRITMISPRANSTPLGRSPRRRSFEVLYTFRAGYYKFDSSVILMPLKEAQSFFGVGDTVEKIEVMVSTPDALEGYYNDIKAALGERFSVTDWKQNNVLVGALQTEQSVMFLILSMLILIASLVIISGLIMLVKEKGPDIAIMRTMGLTRGGVMRVFFMCGASIGFIGTLLGIALGVLVALNITEVKEFIEQTFGVRLFPQEVYLLSQLPSELDWSDVGFTALISLSISFLATLYPARRAAKLDPVEALRNG